MISIPDTLATACRRGRLIPWVGSGVSLSVGKCLFPTWKRLLENLADRLQAEGLTDWATIVRLYRKNGELFKAAEGALDKLGLQRFHEVMREAFCCWAGGWLPDERQWEAAVRGPEGNEYPWGDEWQEGICNTTELGLDRTSPVGIFPTSRPQPFGLDDAAESCGGTNCRQVSGR